MKFFSYYGSVFFITAMAVDRFADFLNLYATDIYEAVIVFRLVRRLAYIPMFFYRWPIQMFFTGTTKCCVITGIVCIIHTSSF